jgi:HAD superfamily hydrolase (TIGR01509 family)
MKISAIITDFDGTLVDTFEANFRAYDLVFKRHGLSISREQYMACFGLRFDAFMRQMGIDDDDLKASIKKDKAQVYPQCFDSLLPNTTLIAFVRKMKLSGVKTAIASTAQKENLMNVLSHLHLTDLFDEIIAGTSVRKGKPDPEIYLKAMDILGVHPEETLIFEDTEVGLQAAESSGASYVRITQHFFE